MIQEALKPGRNYSRYQSLLYLETKKGHILQCILLLVFVCMKFILLPNEQLLFGLLW
jgi:hypothetical protein